MRDDIRRWIESGADLLTGVRFLTLLSPNPELARLVELNPRRYMPLLIRKLKKVSGLVELPRSAYPGETATSSAGGMAVPRGKGLPE